MARLLVFLDGNLVCERKLDKTPLRIGRRPDNDLVLENRTVSRKHATIYFDERGKCWMISNLGETNPVHIRELQVTHPMALFDGDEIQLGSYVIQFQEKESAGTAEAAEKQDAGDSC